MLLNILLGSEPFAEKLLSALIWILALLPALTFHEWAHGYTAYKLGDRTAKADGRLSLNPLDHIDPLGALMMALVGFGWAKPVPVNTRNFRKPKRDMALTSAAGPLMNFIVGFVCTFLFVLFNMICNHYLLFGATREVFSNILAYSAMINVALGFFNLIPLPPLDGSNVLMALLPPRAAMQYSKIRYYSHYILIGVILLSRLPLPFTPFSLLRTAQAETINLFQELAIKMLAPFFEF